MHSVSKSQILNSETFLGGPWGNIKTIILYQGSKFWNFTKNDLDFLSISKQARLTIKPKNDY